LVALVRHAHTTRIGVESRLAAIRHVLAEKRAERNDLRAKLAAARAAASRRTKLLGLAVGVYLLAQFVVCFNWVFFIFDWNLVEPVTYFIGFSCAWLSIAFYTLTGREWTYAATFEVMERRRLLGATKAAATKTYAMRDLVVALHELDLDIQALMEEELALCLVQPTDKSGDAPHATA
jgi:hypothetical protein